jgi:hypothetical protein
MDRCGIVTDGSVILFQMEVGDPAINVSQAILGSQGEVGLQSPKRARIPLHVCSYSHLAALNNLVLNIPKAVWQ